MGYLYIFSTFTFIYISFTHVYSVSVPCGETYLAKNGHHCYPCGEGFSFVSDCVRDEEQSRCKPCEEGEYMRTCDNATKCKICDRFCSPRQEVVEKCTTTNNLKCQCINGTYWKQHPHISRVGDCTDHSKCKAGEGVKKKGTPFEDTECEQCVEGKTFSSSSSFDFCVPCTVCNVTLRKCSVIHDAICGSKPETNHDTEVFDKEEGLKAWQIVLIVVSIVVVIVPIIVVAMHVSRRRQNGKSNADKKMQENTSDAENGHVNIPKYSFSPKNVTQANKNRLYSSIQYPQQNGTIGHRGFINDARKPLLTDNAEKDYSIDSARSFHETREESVSEALKDTKIQHDLKTLDTDEFNAKCTGRKNSLPTISKECKEANIESFMKRGEEEFIHRRTHLDTGPVIETHLERIDAKEIDKLSSNPNESKLGLDKHDKTDQIRENSDEEELKVSDTQKLEAESNNSIRMDAGHVSPRIVRLVSSSLHNPRYTVANEADATRVTECSGSFETETVMQPDGIHVQTDSGTQRPNSGNTAYIFWYEVFTFLVTNLAWNTFKMFYRRLHVGTNSEVFSSIDADIDNAEDENKWASERIYKLMNKWRQRNPKGTTENIAYALVKCDQRLTSEKFLEFINNLKVSDPGVVNGDVTSDCPHNVGETYDRGELSTSANINENIQGNFQQEDNLQMLELK